MEQKCPPDNIIYNFTITLNIKNYKEHVYFGSIEQTF